MYLPRKTKNWEAFVQRTHSLGTAPRKVRAADARGRPALGAVEARRERRGVPVARRVAAGPGGPRVARRDDVRVRRVVGVVRHEAHDVILVVLDLEVVHLKAAVVGDERGRQRAVDAGRGPSRSGSSDGGSSRHGRDFARSLTSSRTQLPFG